jgi:hypothetical protein
MNIGDLSPWAITAFNSILERLTPAKTWPGTTCLRYSQPCSGKPPWCSQSFRIWRTGRARANRVLDHGMRCAVIVGGIRDENVDFVQSGGDGQPHSAMPGVDDIDVSTIRFRGDHRRLHDADRLDPRQHQCIRLRRRLRLAHPVRVSFSARRSTFMIRMGFILSGGSGAAPCRPFLSSSFPKDASRTAGRPDRRNCGRASLLGRASGASSPA